MGQHLKAAEIFLSLSSDKHQASKPSTLLFHGSIDDFEAFCTGKLLLNISFSKGYIKKYIQFDKKNFPLDAISFGH